MSFVLIGFFVLQIVLGLVYCFFGYRFLRPMVTALCFLAGGFAAYLLLNPIISSNILCIVLSFIIGAGVAALAYLFYVVGIFLVGASFGAVAASLIMSFAGIDFNSTLFIVVSCVSAAAVGALTVAYKRAFIIIATAFSGSASAAAFGTFFFTHMNVNAKSDSAMELITLAVNATIKYCEENIILVGCITVVLALAGLFVQFKHTAPTSIKYMKKQTKKKSGHAY